MIPNIIDTSLATNTQVLNTLKKAAEIIRKIKWKEHWTSEAGQEELLQMLEERSQRPGGN